MLQRTNMINRLLTVALVGYFATAALAQITESTHSNVTDSVQSPPASTSSDTVQNDTQADADEDEYSGVETTSDEVEVPSPTSPAPPPVSTTVHPLYKLSDNLFLVVIPIITGVGVVGNALMFLTVQRPAMRSSSVSVYISALSVADTFVLIWDFINNWIYTVTRVHLKSTSAGFCQFYNFMFTTVYTYAAWLVVCVAVERVIVVWFPLRARELCTVKKARIVVCTIPVLSAIFHSYNFLIWIINPDSGRCDVSSDHLYYVMYVYPWLTGVFYSYIPLVILVVANGAIICGLLRASRNRKELAAAPSSKNDETQSITRTVVSISTMFILLTVPLTIFYALIFSSSQFVHQTPSMRLGRTIILILGLSNHAINFFLYIITSVTFRRELKMMLCCAAGNTGSHIQQKLSRRKAMGNTAAVPVSSSQDKTESGETTSKNATDQTPVASCSVEVSLEPSPTENP